MARVMPRMSALCAVAATAGLPWCARGQVVPLRAQDLAFPQELIPVDRGIEDINPLGVSLRQLPPEFRLDNDWEQVYVSRVDPSRFVRVHGALHAVFPRSQYVSTRDGVRSQTPPGTVFYIGPPAPELLPVPSLAAELTEPSSVRRPTAVTLAPPMMGAVRAGAVDRSAAAVRLGPRAVAQPAGLVTRVRPGPATLASMADEPYRRARIRQLTNRATSGLE